MSDEIRKIRGLRDVPEDEPDAELTTADLAGASQSRPIPANDGPTYTDAEIIDAEVESVEVREAPVATDRRAPLASDAPKATARGTATPAAAAVAPAKDIETGPLFTNGEAGDLRARWDTIQVGFVDEPRHAVEQADNLVAGTMKRLAEIFAAERSKLESQWDKGENVSTEDLRLALRRYRSFFGRLLSI
jgi:hypothetical protein